MKLGHFQPESNGGLMTRYQKLQNELRSNMRVWVVTGAAGFIGSHLVETLLRLNQRVIGVDNFRTGKPSNLEEVLHSLPRQQAKRFVFEEIDITMRGALKGIFSSAHYILHQAALSSVPASIQNPVETQFVNEGGFVNVLDSLPARKKIRLVYASSSAVYGNSTQNRLDERQTGQALSPYGVTKQANELYGALFSSLKKPPCIGLRYFNIFGPRQNENGSYAGVISQWIRAACCGTRPTLYGDGLTTRDFCHVSDVVQANLLAACQNPVAPSHSVFNIGSGRHVSLKQLLACIAQIASDLGLPGPRLPAHHRDSRPGDVRHSRADISKARRLLGYRPSNTLAQQLKQTMLWYQEQHQKSGHHP
jgi:UDP-N-acetylglucosamine 4-epimerase